MTAATGVRDEQLAREAQVIGLYHRGDLDTKTIAKRVGVTPRTVRRILVRRGVTELQDPGHIKPDVAMRIAVYAAEGMPANWIAEDLPVRYETALRHAQRAPGHAEAVHEWQIVWHQIRKDPALLELHYEIAPLWSELRLRALDAA